MYLLPGKWPCAHRQFSPRVWGCTAMIKIHVTGSKVFPTRVGMYRSQGGQAAQAGGFSPRVWGCTRHLTGMFYRRCVFPTRVGMYRLGMRLKRGKECFPHACGDVPKRKSGTGLTPISFPHACGDVPAMGRLSTRERQVFPTRVGMYRIWCSKSTAMACFPHACGDVPFSA